jgi:hypothetical protein
MRTAHVHFGDLQKVVSGEMTEEEYFAKHECQHSPHVDEDELAQAVKEDEVRADGLRRKH